MYMHSYFYFSLRSLPHIGAINVQNFLTAFQDLILINHKSPAQKNDVSEGCPLADIGGQ